MSGVGLMFVGILDLWNMPTALLATHPISVLLAGAVLCGLYITLVSISGFIKTFIKHNKNYKEE
jgi:hypothetical protein